MGGYGSGLAKRKPIKLICQWEDCREEFIDRRKDAKFCSQSCRDNKAFRDKMIKSGEIIRCRICRKIINIKTLKQHFKEHNIKL
ncbi:MAG TPA: hypothetical protein PKI46_01025 [Bacteroidales bacterium]|nr:hypothetical protein [Bacteroidales bacterium]